MWKPNPLRSEKYLTGFAHQIELWTAILKFSFNLGAKSANEQQNTPSMKAC